MESAIRSSLAAFSASATSGAFGSSNGSSSGSGGPSSRTNSGRRSAGAAFFSTDADDDDDFGAFAAAPSSSPALSPPAAPVTSDYYAGVFGASSSASSLVPPPPSNLLSASLVSGLSELSFADDDYDSPFADIVNEPPKSVNASRNNSFSHSGNGPMPFELLPQQQQVTHVSGIEMDSPLLSFSPMATPSTLSMAPSVSSLPVDIFSVSASSSVAAATSVDVFSLSASSVSSAPDEAELLSFSPLALPTSAPSAAPAMSSFLLDAPAPSVSTGSPSKPAPRFSLPPPRAATMPSQSPGAVSPAKAASFSSQVFVGELLSFSPVASAPVSSFSDSIGSSATATASIFGDDELFSLSAADLDFSTTSAAVAEPAAADAIDAPVASPSPELSPVSFGDSMSQDFTVSQSSTSLEITSPSAKEEDADTLTPEPAAQVVEAEDEFEFQGVQQDEKESVRQGSPVSSEKGTLSEEEAAHAEFEELQQSASDNDNGFSISENDLAESRAVEETAVEAAQDAQRLLIPSPVGYSQFDFITQGFSPVASQSDDQAGSSSALERDVSASSSSPPDVDQYQPFSQDSVNDQYTSLGDLSEGEFGGYSASSARSQESKRQHELRSTPGGSEAARTPTGQGDGSEALEYASFSSSGSNEQPSQFDVEANAEEQQAGAIGGSSVATSLTISGPGESETAEFGGFEAVNGSAAQDDDFDDFGAPPSSVDAVQSGFGGFQPATNIVSGIGGADDTEFGGFGAAPTSEPLENSFQSMTATSFLPANGGAIDDFGGFSTGSFGGDASDDFGDFGQSSSALDGGNDDDDFGDFGQSSSAVGGDDDDDDDAFGGFGQASSSDFGASDDDFGDFNGPPPASTAPSSFEPVTIAPSITTPPSSKPELDIFFRQAFSVHSTPTPLDTSLHVPASPSQTSKELFQDKHGRSNELVATIYRAAVESYFQDTSSAIGSTAIGTELYSSELKALRLKHLKYVLTEKIQEASRHDGIFPHGSDKHHLLLSLVNSDDEQQMRDALTSVQDSLFSSSVNDAMMRIARQAALSAKAKIAEQAAHQQASSRGSLLATTRQLLSRSGGGTAGSGGSGHDNEASAASSSSTNGTGSGGEDSGGENDGSGRNSYEADSAPHTPGTGRNSGSGGSSSSGSSGGLMRKFQDRFSSFSTSRNRTRLVSLRRMGQSGEDVRKMELNMDSISGGLDEVKWKCAVFLYDVDEVAQVAPSQISILSYPGKEVLAGKSDRTALMKFLKPGAIWTIDIGASNNDVLNEW